MAVSSSGTPRPLNSVASSPITSAADDVLRPVFAFVSRLAAPALRISLGVILLWIGLLKFHDPSPIVGLIQASFLLRPLGFNGLVYVLGSLEVLAALLLFFNVGVRYVGLLVALLFVGTLSIFLTAPAVTFGVAGFPFLALAGQFLLKDLALGAAALMLVALDVARHASGEDASMPRMRADLADLRRRIDAMERSSSAS